MAPLGTSAELDFMFADAGIAVVYGAQSCNGFLDKETMRAGHEGVEVVDGEESLVIRDGALTALANDTAITVDGIAYKIRDTGFALTDGTRRITIVRATP